MFLGLKDSYIKPLPEISEIKDRINGRDDVTAVIELARIVQGSRPIYATGKWVNLDELMSTPMGDCNLVSLRFIEYSKKLGFKGIRRWELNDYLPGHVFVDTTKGKNRFLVDIDHGVVVEIFEGMNSGNNYNIHYLPNKINYYLPGNVFMDRWGSVEALRVWFVEVRENRWPMYLRDKGIEHINTLPTDRWPKKLN